MLDGRGCWQVMRGRKQRCARERDVGRDDEGTKRARTESILIGSKQVGKPESEEGEDDVTRH